MKKDSKGYSRMHKIKYYIISLAVLMVVFAAVVNLKDFSVKETIVETKNVTQPVSQPIHYSVDPNVIVASNLRLGVNLTHTSHDDLIQRLKKINPSYLRDERLLSSDASISGFLDTCVRVGANPWIVIPTNLDVEVLDLLGFYLKEWGSKFSNVIVEIGHEDKNYVFSYEQSPYFDASSYMTEDDENKVYLTIAQRLAQNEALSLDAMKLPVDSGGDLTINQTQNSAQAIFGTALAKIVIDLLPYKPNPLMILSPAQPELLWAPTDLAASMLNQVIGGSLHHLTPTSTQNESLTYETANLTLAAFRTADHWTAAIASANPNSVDVTIEFPDDGLNVPVSASILQYANSHLDANESVENVKIVNQPVQIKQRNVVVTVPAYGFVVLLDSSQI